MGKPATGPFRCSLCGYEFVKADTACTHGCPLGQSCNLTRCPNCGYEFPSEPKALSWLANLFRRRVAPPAAPAGEALPLPELEVGETAELVTVNGASAKRKNALAVYGMVPGCTLVLQQRRPAFVVRVGETELALEETIARELLVRRLTS